MKEYGLEKHIHPDFLKKDSLTIGALSGEIMPVKLEVLSILQALEFADYSEKAKEKALGKLASMLEELSREGLTPENLQKIGLIAFAIEILKRGEFRRVEEIKKL